MQRFIRHGTRAVLHFLLHHVAGPLIAFPVRRRLAQFEAATHRPRELQDALLRDIVAHQANTAFGRDHRFDAIRTRADFCRQLPVAEYDYFEPYIARVRRGETAALLADPKVYMFALTSGTTATRKYIPVTDSYLADYRRGWNMWGLRAYHDHPEVSLQPIVQMSGDWNEFQTEAGIPCGAVTGLTATVQKRVIRWLYCVPACVGRIKDAHAKYYTALRLSLPSSVGLILAANPSTMINLARFGDQEKESLIRDVADGTLSTRFDIPTEVRAALKSRLRRDPERARQLEEIVARTGTLYPKDYWPRKCLLGNWTGGSMGAYLRHYPRYYGDHPVRDVGLIASEGRMTIPIADHTPAGILDVTTHYFEFIPEGELKSPQPTVLAAHEVKEGGTYYILPTTSYGLYRYQIHDLVRVTGFYNQTPLVEFLSKGALFSNFTGEKISEYHVTHSMAAVLRELDLTVSAYTVAPCWPNGNGDFEQPYYGLFLERGEIADATAAERLVELLEIRLRSVNEEYAAKRDSLRLGGLRVEWLRPGFWQEWDRERLKKTGGVLDQYKRPCLISDPHFSREAQQAQVRTQTGL
jgi:hypothetical protein